MREILFRGKRIDNGEWVEGWYVPPIEYNGNKFGTAISHICEGGYLEDTDVAPSTVGQYTGLTDKNGNRIFEGDVCRLNMDQLRLRDWDKGDMCWVGKVHWEYQQFVISGGPNKEYNGPFILQMSRFSSDDIEVIGNIHDNPELVKEG